MEKQGASWKGLRAVDKFDSKLWVTIGDGPSARVVLMRGVVSLAQLRPAEARSWAEVGAFGNMVLPAETCENLRMMADEIEARGLRV